MASEFDVEKSLEKVSYREQLIIDVYGDGVRSEVCDVKALDALNIMSFIKEALEAGRVPAKPVEDRPICRGQAESIINKQTVINRRLGEIESKMGGDKKKWRDQIEQRIEQLEAMVSPAKPVEKDTIEIDREMARRFAEYPFHTTSVADMVSAIKQALGREE